MLICLMWVLPGVGLDLDHGTISPYFTDGNREA
jgi:hypothetical protein